MPKFVLIMAVLAVGFILLATFWGRITRSWAVLTAET